jgi:hypothetical protein
MRPVQLSSFPAFANSSTLDGFIRGLPPFHECRGIRVELEFTIKNQAAANQQYAVGDHNKIATAIVKRVRFTYNDKTDAYNLTPAEARALATYATGRDPFPQMTRLTLPAASAIPTSAGTAIAAKLSIFLPFHNRNLENPNLFAPSSLQLNRDGTKITIETDGTGLTGLVLGNATVNVVVTGIKVYCNMMPTVVDSKNTKVEYCSPTLYARSRSVSQFPDTERGPLMDMFLAVEQDYRTNLTNVANYTVEHDGVAAPRNIPPDTLAACYGESQVQHDALFKYDIVDPDNGIGTQLGSQLSPLCWIDGSIKSAEYELPIFLDYRAIVANPVTGGSLSFTLLYWRVAPMDEAVEVVKQLLLIKGMGDVPYARLAVKGGGGSDNGLFAMFKPRWLAVMAAAK